MGVRGSPCDIVTSHADLHIYIQLSKSPSHVFSTPYIHIHKRINVCIYTHTYTICNLHFHIHTHLCINKKYHTRALSPPARNWSVVSMDKYEVVKDLGAGNFGVARLMRHKETKQLVAMKYIMRGQKVCVLIFIRVLFVKLF